MFKCILSSCLCSLYRNKHNTAARSRQISSQKTFFSRLPVKLINILLGRWRNNKVWQWSDESIFGLFQTDGVSDHRALVSTAKACGTKFWCRLAWPTQVSIQHTCLFFEVIWRQNIPNYLFFPLKDFFGQWKCQDSLDSNCGREL